jgi:hypothetical protein
MLTIKDLMTSGAQSSPDGKHWEPAIPLPMFGWRHLWRDAWAVLNGRAVAIRQTTNADIEVGQ